MNWKDGLLLPAELFDFRNYLHMAFKELGLPNPTKRQYAIAEYIQRGPRRLQLQGFRGVGKSIILEIFATWCYRVVYAHPEVNPEYSLKVISAAESRAANFSGFVKALVNKWSLLQDLAPGPEMRKSVLGWDVNRTGAQDSPSMAAMGIKGTLTGGRADISMLDDVETPQNSLTTILRERVSEGVREVDALLKPIEEAEVRHRFPHLPREITAMITGRNIVLGTPQTEESVYPELTKRGYAPRIVPSRYPDKKWMSANGHHLDPAIAQELEDDPSLSTGWGATGKSGKPTDTRFSNEDLIERELSFGRSQFALQYMLDVTLSDADRYPLKLSDLMIFDLDQEKAPENLIWTSNLENAIRDIPNVGFGGDRYYSPFKVSDEWAEYTGCVMAIDPSGRGKDETAYAVVAMLNSFLFVKEVGGFGPGSGFEDEILDALAKVAKRNRVNTVLVEQNFGGGMFSELLKPFLRRTYPVSIDDHQSTGAKEKRIISILEPVCNQHRLVWNKSVVTNDRFVGDGVPEEFQSKYLLAYQFSRLTADRGALVHDDRLDALSMAVEYWMESMALDANVEIQSRRSDLMDKELRGFYENTYGFPSAESQMSFIQSMDPFRRN